MTSTTPTNADLQEVAALHDRRINNRNTFLQKLRIFHAAMLELVVAWDELHGDDADTVVAILEDADPNMRKVVGSPDEDYYVWIAFKEACYQKFTGDHPTSSTVSRCEQWAPDGKGSCVWCTGHMQDHPEVACPTCLAERVVDRDGRRLPDNPLERAKVLPYPCPECDRTGWVPNPHHEDWSEPTEPLDVGF